jgi:hypothetical protein
MPSFFQSLLPMHNPIGFGAADYLELFLALMLTGLAMAWRPWIERYGRRLAENGVWSMVLLAVLPIVLRLLLLPHHPVPAPNIYDEFGHLLVADTLRHWRFANPAHPLHQFFETFFTLQQPTYSSIYPIGQGLMLAVGRAVFLTPWAGVLLSTAAFCSLCYWMLRGWTSPGWALAGGMVAVFEFGPLSQWMNSYWGGALGAAAGCLVLGALPRSSESERWRYPIALGAGLALHLLIRPFESVFLFLSVALFLVPTLRHCPQAKTLLQRTVPVVGVAVALALGITLVQDKSVTGNWTTLPYQLSQYQYGVPAALTFQANPVPHVDLTPQQELGYKSQLAFRAAGPESLRTYFERPQYRVRYYRFFFLPPLYLAILAFVPAMRQWRFAWVGITLALFALGTNFFPAFQLHYLAAVTCLFVLISVEGLRRIYQLRQEAGLVLLFLCAAHFIFWYGMHVFDTADFSMEARSYETWDAINHANPERRIQITDQLAKISGQVLVFVQYWPQHVFQDEWVYNQADIDHARIVWARDLGAQENEKLQQYYTGRSVWLLEPDALPPKLEPYVKVKPEVITPTPSAAPPPKGKSKPAEQLLHFEEVPRAK